MTISIKDWDRFVQRLGSVSKKAADELRIWVNKQGGLISIDRQALIDYAYALATKYGEGTSALAASWYDAVAEASGKFLPPGGGRRHRHLRRDGQGRQRRAQDL